MVPERSESDLSSACDLRHEASEDPIDSVEAETSLINAVYLDSKAELVSQSKPLGGRALDLATASKLLHLCCNFDSVECASALLGGQLGATPLVNELDEAGKTPLHTAVESHALRCVEALLKKHARTDLRTKDGEAQLPLELSLTEARLDIYWNPNDFSKEEFVLHITEKDLSIVRLLSDKTKEIAEVAYSYAVQGRVASLTALLIVAAEKVIDSVLELRNSKSGCKEKLTIYECLIREALALGGHTTTPLRAAKRKLLLREIDLLQLFGAVVQSGGGDKKVTSPLIRAAQGGDKAVIQLLLKTNIDVNDADADGNSALHWILASSILSHPQQISIILLLLEHGALVRQRNKMGLTAFHIAAGNGNSKALEILLLEDPLAVQYMTEMKETPLFFAVKNGSKDCTELLLTWRANSEVLNVRGQKAIDLATSQDMRDILLNITTVSLVNQAFPNQHKCTALEVTDEDTTTERHLLVHVYMFTLFIILKFLLPANARNVNSITKAEACKYFESHQGYVRGVQDGAYQSHSYAAKQLKRKIFVGGLPPSVDSDVLGKFFEEFGSVEDAVVIVTQIEKKIQSRGFGFVTFREEKSALEAMQANYVTMRGKKVEIKSLIPKLVFRAEFEKMSPQQREQDKDFQLPLQKSNEYIREGDNPEQGSCADRLVLGQPAACSIEHQAHVTKSSEDPSTPTWLKVFKKWFPGFLQGLLKHSKYALSSLKADFRAKFGLELDHSSVGYSKLSDFLKCFSDLCTVEILSICKRRPPSHMIVRPNFFRPPRRLLHTLRTPHTLSFFALIENGGDSKCLSDLSMGIGGEYSKCLQDHSKCFHDHSVADSTDSKCLQNLSIAAGSDTNCRQELSADNAADSRCLQDLSLDFGGDSKCIQDLSICNGCERCGLNVTSYGEEKSSFGYTKVKNSRFLQFLKPDPVLHGPIYQEKLHRETKGTTIIAWVLDQAPAVMAGFDSRITKHDELVSDTSKKFEIISPKILALGAGSYYDIKKTFNIMKYCIPNKIMRHPEVIFKLGEYARDRPVRKNVDLYTCFILGVQSEEPTLYRLDSDLDPPLEKCDGVELSGTGDLAAYEALTEETEEPVEGFHVEDTHRKVKYAFLKAALTDPSTGGIITVAYIDDDGMERMSSNTVVELYIQFYDKFRYLEDRIVFLFYDNVQKKKLPSFLGKKINENAVEEVGHPLTQLHGGEVWLETDDEGVITLDTEIQMQRMVFKTNTDAINFFNKAIAVDDDLSFSSSARAFIRFYKVSGKKIYVAKQSIELLESLVILRNLRNPLYLP